ncbi:Sarcosine oxidase subunit beta [Hyphomicrobiales bacterium]|nr:Sarcosine oxidase subunit beta [Hyphomicrobiales bacterium]CAH1695236.1 Sarcosine oxidase subunit beta [Hyphomicrobiales bacterium]
MTDVVVIGAGISGAASAYELAKAGLDVVLVDRFGPAAMASGWTLAGVRQSGRHPAELPLARAAVALWPTLASELDGATHYRRSGNLRLARTEAEAAVIRQLVDEQSSAGLEIDFLASSADVRAVAPALSERVLCASLCQSDGSADAAASVAAFVKAAERLGARLRFGERVIRLQTERGRITGVKTDRGSIAARHVVVAAGIFGNELIAPFGLHVPLEVPMVTVLRSAPMASVLEQVIGVANADCAGRQEHNGRFRVTSGLKTWPGRMQDVAGPEGIRPRVMPTADSIGEVVRLIGDVIPAFQSAEIEDVWSGLIDLTPDALPVIDAPELVEGLVVAMGFSGHGFCLGPITGRIVRDLVTNKATHLPIAPFAIDRFGSLSGVRAPATLHG